MRMLANMSLLKPVTENTKRIFQPTVFISTEASVKPGSVDLI